MAEGILSSVSGIIIDKLGSLAFDEIQLTMSSKDDLRKLCSTLSSVKAFILDAEEQQLKSHAVKDWVEKLRDVLQDSQDLLDDLFAEQTRQRVELQWPIVKQVCDFFFNNGIGHRVGKIRERIDEISTERNQFHFKEKVETYLIKREETESFVRFTKVIGRENDIDAIVGLLTGTEDFSVIPIVGMGGLGKTTVAQMVFNDQRVKALFQIRIWLCISHGFSSKSILQKMVRAVTDVDCGNLGMESLYHYLQQIFNGKNVLVVLDDLWDADHVEWAKLKDVVTDVTKGCYVLLTTRNRSAALLTGTVTSYHLPGLPDKDCWTLFEKWAFRGSECRYNPNLVQIGMEIVRRCGGVPLAIRTLGSLLYLIRDESYWLFVKDNEIWDIAQRENDILAVLRLSYDQLPLYLKQCFAYCSLLQKDQEFDKETVIQLWMAQGFLHVSHKHHQLEDIGSFYFNELVSRSFFDIVRENYKSEIVKCRMHDLVHDLAVSVAGKEYLTANVSEGIRHASFYGHYLPDEANAFPKFPKLRSIIMPVILGNSSQLFLDGLISSSAYLRVLDLSYSGVKYLPSCIGHLKHLRYLDLNGNADIRYLPDSISKLYFLQTSKLLGCVQISYFPAKFSNLFSLRHLTISLPKMRTWAKQLNGLTSLETFSIMHCNNLVSLSQEMQQLTALRTLRIHNCSKLNSLPYSMKIYSHLQNLEVVNCPKIHLNNDCLRGLVSLGSLIIKGVPKVVNLLQGLEFCATTLKYLSIIDCPSLMTFPESLGSLSYLKRLYISNCPNLLCLPLHIHHLTALQVLQIDQCHLLSERCQREVGEDWPKLAHIPEIYVDRIRI